MSHFRVLFLQCDWAYCGESLEQDDEDTTIAGLRAYAHGVCWSSKGRLDHCPKHSGRDK